MDLLVYGQTDVGRHRKHNEDTLLLRPDLGLYMVCDGMGGHAGGEVASAKAAEVVSSAVENDQEVLASFDFDDPSSKEALLATVRDSVERASAAVYELATSDGGKAGMGTTLTSVLVTPSAHGVMAHVGDSRLYMLRDGQLHQLSEDHSYINEMVKRGMITMEKAKKSPYANVITRAVGIQSSVAVDTLVFDICAGDTYLICSDGLTRYFEDESELAGILANDNVSKLPEQLIAMANERGGRDNISVVVMRAVPEDGSAEDEARSTEVNLRIETLRYISLFKWLTMKELVKCLEIFRVENWDPGQIVVREGEAGNSLYVVMDGELDVERGGKVINAIEKGSHFGEMSLLSSRPRSATVRTKTASRLLVMDAPRFSELIQAEPALGVKFLWTFSQVLAVRLDEATEQDSEPPPFR
jgi:serine/threonine protein phosphatase PrpC